MTGVRCEVASRDNMFRTPLHWAAVLGKVLLTISLVEMTLMLICWLLADLVIAFTVKLTDSRYTCSPTLIESTSVPHTDINFLTGSVNLFVSKKINSGSSCVDALWLLL